MIKKFLFVLVSILFGYNFMAARCPIQFKGCERATVGIYIEKISTGDKLEEYNADKSMTPASTLKSLTCASALTMLGPDYRFLTDFYLVGSDVRAGDADLVVVGAADPTLGSRHFKSSANVLDSVSTRLSESGATYIDGTIRIDGEVLPEGGGVIPRWEVEDISESYGVGLYPVNWYDNYFESDQIIQSPPEYFAQQLGVVLTMEGININGNELEADSIPLDSVHVYTHRSSPLKEIMKSLMVRSDNLMAEGTMRALAHGQPSDSAIVAMKGLWSGFGLDLSETKIVDGSGLARCNAIAPGQLGKMLTLMARSGYASEYVSLFPKAGKEGTVKTLLAGTRLAGLMALKSGSMSGVHTYAGYLLDKKSGKPTHSVVVMVNNFYCTRTQLRKAIETYLLQKLP